MSKQMNLLSEEQGTPLFSQPVERKPIAKVVRPQATLKDGTKVTIIGKTDTKIMVLTPRGIVRYVLPDQL